MRKFLLVIVALLFLAGGSVKAQTFEFQYQGQSLKDGATVTIAAEANAFGELSCETNPSANPNNGLVLKVSEELKGKASARLEILHNTLNASLVQWCMGGECTFFGTKSFLTKSFETSGNDQVLFDASNIRDKGYLMAELTVTLGAKSLVVNIQFTNGESAGINGVPNTPGALNVYNLRGQILTKDADDTKLLPAGIYIVGGKKYLKH